MSLAYTPDIFNELRDVNLLLDTCTIIDSSNCDEIDNFLRRISTSGCTFLSLPAVREEFTCSAKNLNDYNKLMDYIDTLGIVFLNNVFHNIGIYEFNVLSFSNKIRNV